MTVENEDALRQYFDLFGSQFMDKLPNPVRINKGDKHMLHDEINKLEQYLIKNSPNLKNKYLDLPRKMPSPQSQNLNFKKAKNEVGLA